MLEDGIEGIGEASSCRYASEDVGLLQRDQIDELRLEPAVDARLARVVVRIVALPAVVMHARVQRHRAVPGVVTEPADVERGIHFDVAAVLPGGGCRTIAAHPHLDALVGFDRGIRQRSGPSDVGELRALGIGRLQAQVLVVERQHELVPRARNDAHECELLAEPAVVRILLILRNGSLAMRHESGVIDRMPIQSICALTNAGTSSGSKRTATRLITRWAVAPQANSGTSGARRANVSVRISRRFVTPFLERLSILRGATG